MKRWFQSLPGSRPDLYRAIYDWNAYPHRWALPAWLRALAVPAPVIARLEQSAVGRRRLSAHFRQALGLEEMLWDFRDPRRRLALLKPLSLERLARFAGAVVHAGRLARIVTQADRRALDGRIGAEVYTYALRRGRAIPVPASLIPSDAVAAELPEQIEAAGWSALGSCLAEEPESLRRRVQLKAPPDRELFAVNGAATEAWSLVQPMVRECLSPEEARCFA